MTMRSTQTTRPTELAGTGRRFRERQWRGPVNLIVSVFQERTRDESVLSSMVTPAPLMCSNWPDQLALSPAQRNRTEQVFWRMQTRAREVGARLIKKSEDLMSCLRQRRFRARLLRRP
jgi:hypothetical protein